MSDALDRLRQYLEQRRELGESEFVLDGLSVEDALKALGGSAALRVGGSAAGGAAAGAALGGQPQPRGAAAGRAAAQCVRHGAGRRGTFV